MTRAPFWLYALVFVQAAAVGYLYGKSLAPAVAETRVICVPASDALAGIIAKEGKK